MIRIQNIQAFLKHHLSQIVNKGDTVVDATAGNGKDTLFLAGLVGETGTVHAFDIQAQAINKTRRLLEQNNLIQSVKLYHDDHALLEYYLQAPIKAAMFNLGYLPGADTTIITRPESTIKAIMGVCNLLDIGGLMTITIYRGHPGGVEEAKMLLDRLSSLPKDFSVLSGQYINVENTAPFWIMVQKK